MVGLPTVVCLPWYRADVDVCSDIHKKTQKCNGVGRT